MSHPASVLFHWLAFRLSLLAPSKFSEPLGLRAQGLGRSGASRIEAHGSTWTVRFAWTLSCCSLLAYTKPETLHIRKTKEQGKQNIRQTDQNQRFGFLEQCLHCTTRAPFCLHPSTYYSLSCLPLVHVPNCPFLGTWSLR